MLEASNNNELPPIPGKRYFTIGEVSELCGVKPHVLRYWEQEFTQLKPVKRRGNRRYYQHHEVLLIRRIRELLYEEGFTISGARNRLDHSLSGEERHDNGARLARASSAGASAGSGTSGAADNAATGDDRHHEARAARPAASATASADTSALKRELRELLEALRTPQ